MWAWPASAGDRPEALPWKVNTPIVSVKKELYRKHPRPGASAGASDGYIGPKLERLAYQAQEIQDDVTEGVTARFSSDNGRTWTEFKPIPQTQPDPAAAGMSGAGPTVFDPTSGLLVGMFLRQMSVGSQSHNYTYVGYSRDFGRSWTKPALLRYEPGDDFDPKNHLKPSFLQHNQGYLGSNILIRHDGALVHCVGLANAPHDPDNDSRDYRNGSLCFIGQWNPQAKDYIWAPGKRVEVSTDITSRGLLEPAVAELTDKRLLVVWRGSDTPKTPGRKWFSISKDGGMTLSDPAEWKYDDGSRFYSPSSKHAMLRHSVTGRLYWFGNICPEPPDGNWPRYPLVIAEIDEKLAALKRSTVTAIDDRRPDQKGNVQFTNFSLMENRETHDLQILLTIYGEDPGDWRNSDCYKYTLRLE